MYMWSLHPEYVVQKLTKKKKEISGKKIFSDENVPAGKFLAPIHESYLYSSPLCMGSDCTCSSNMLFYTELRRSILDLNQHRYGCYVE